MFFPQFVDVENDESSGRLGIRPRSEPSNYEDTKEKRMKETVELPLPAIVDGVLSASKTPQIDGAKVVDIPFRGTNLEKDDGGVMKMFFDETCVQSLGDNKIDASVMNMLKNNDASEEMLRDIVFRDFANNHGISFATNSYSNETGKTINDQYREKTVNTILADFGGSETGKMARIMRDLPVTTTSKPDLVALDNRNGREELWMGEFKNAPNYDESNARFQCTTYLMSLLYWLRAVQGRSVEAVFGFYVCGCLCKDQRGMKYVVGLLKLNAPRIIGDQLNVDFIRCKKSLDDPMPLQLLLEFFKNGRQWTIFGDFKVERPIPALFVLPSRLWNDTEHRKLVHHGSLSIVFKISLQGLKDLLGDSSAAEDKGFALSPDIVNDEDNYDVKHLKQYCLDLFSKIANKEHDETILYYLKIRTKNAAWQDFPMKDLVDAWGELRKQLPQILEMYPSRPFTTQIWGMVLMYDRGTRLADTDLSSDSVNKQKCLSQFKAIYDVANSLSEILPHTDALPHNIVVNQEFDMTLIDVDEGVKTEKSGGHGIPCRKNDYGKDSDQDWFLAISYPNPLHQCESLYTRAQLLLSFLVLISKLTVPPQLKPEVSIILNSAKELGVALKSFDVQNFTFDSPEEVKNEKKIMDPLSAAERKMYEILENIV